MGRRYWTNDDDRPSHSSTISHEFRDADLDLGEIPLDQLDTFVVSATDEQGHGEHIHFRVPRYILHAIKVIIASKRFPYLDLGYFFRHAATRHLAWLSSLRHTIPQHIRPHMELVLECCRQDEIQTTIQLTFAKLQERIDYHLGRGDHGEVVRLLNIVRTKLAGVEDGAGKREMIKAFEERWAHHLGGRDSNRLTAANGVNGGMENGYYHQPQ